MATPFTGDGYTDQEADAIHRALITAHLKPDADWLRLLSDITMLVSDVCEGHSHPDTVLYAGDMKRRLQAVLTGLEATANAYDQLGDRLHAHIEAQKQIPERCHDCGQQQWKDWAALVFEHNGTDIGPLPTQAVNPSIQRPYALGRLVDHALAAGRQALERPIDPMISYVQKQGAPKNHAMHLIVTDLLAIFEQATGTEPKVYTSQTTDNGYAGNFYPFAVACLAPLRLVPRKQLGSSILSVYTLSVYKQGKNVWKKQCSDQMKALNRALKPR
jgi:hypothetical protein